MLLWIYKSESPLSLLEREREFWTLYSLKVSVSSSIAEQAWVISILVKSVYLRSCLVPCFCLLSATTEFLQRRNWRDRGQVKSWRTLSHAVSRKRLKDCVPGYQLDRRDAASDAFNPAPTPWCRDGRRTDQGQETRRSGMTIPIRLGSSSKVDRRRVRDCWADELFSLSMRVLTPFLHGS